MQRRTVALTDSDGRSVNVGSGGGRGSRVAAAFAASSVVDRERSRSYLLLAALVIIVLTLPLPQHVDVHLLPSALAIAGLVVTWLLSCVRRLTTLMNRIAGGLIALQITGLVAITGGPRSAYTVLYAMLLLYAAVFYGTRDSC
jgi:hypothetical protein